MQVEVNAFAISPHGSVEATHLLFIRVYYLELNGVLYFRIFTKSYIPIGILRFMGRSSSAVYNLDYHVVFCPKYRKQVLVGDVEIFLKDCFNIIAETNGWKNLQMEVMPDHVHIFL
jgi:hypothetical protein